MPAHPPEARTATLALLAAALLLMGFAAASQVELVHGSRAPCQNTGTRPAG
jgi:hypothetical protein